MATYQNLPWGSMASFLMQTANRLPGSMEEATGGNHLPPDVYKVGQMAMDNLPSVDMFKAPTEIAKANFIPQSAMQQAFGRKLPTDQVVRAAGALSRSIQSAAGSIGRGIVRNRAEAAQSRREQEALAKKNKADANHLKWGQWALENGVIEPEEFAVIARQYGGTDTLASGGYDHLLPEDSGPEGPPPGYEEFDGGGPMMLGPMGDAAPTMEGDSGVTVGPPTDAVYDMAQDGPPSLTEVGWAAKKNPYEHLSPPQQVEIDRDGDGRKEIYERRYDKRNGRVYYRKLGEAGGSSSDGGSAIEYLGQGDKRRPFQELTDPDGSPYLQAVPMLDETGTPISEAQGQEKQHKAKVFTDTIETMMHEYVQLEKKGALRRPGGNPFSNLFRHIASSELGQVVNKAYGSPEQEHRDLATHVSKGLMHHIRNAEGLGVRGMDTPAELKFYMEQLGGPGMSLPTNIALLDRLDQQYGDGTAIQRLAQYFPELGNPKLLAQGKIEVAQQFPISVIREKRWQAKFGMRKGLVTTKEYDDTPEMPMNEMPPPEQIEAGSAPGTDTQPPQPPPEAIEYLRQNPGLAPMFEQKYGVPAKGYLGG